jgi:folate-binding protein YgfZ
MTESAIPQAAPVTRPTDENPPLTPQATPLAALLTKASAGTALAAYRGVRTPRELDAPARETAALAHGAAVHDLGWLRRVAVRGEDRFRWLSGMVTNTVNDLAANAGAWNLVLSAQGRIQGDLHVWREADHLDLEIAADQYGRLLVHLDRFIIMDDVELAPLSLDPNESPNGSPDQSPNGSLSCETALGLSGPLAAGVLERLGLSVLPDLLTSVCAAWNGQEMRVVRAYGALVPHYELWVRAAQIPALWRALVDAGATPVGAASLEAFRIAEGIPAYGIDMAERDLPQETSQMRALNFNKGCYLGQEVVERIHSRGSVHRHLRPLELFGPLPAAGAALTLDGGAVAGEITSVAQLPLPSGLRIFALGMIRGEAEVHNQPFAYTAGPATGAARILTAPPVLEPVSGVNKSTNE